MKWMIPEDRLGPDQREVINELTDNWRNTWIKGHAGSGKSVLLIHLLRDYLAKNPNDKVCVVVFTNSLVDMLRTGIIELDLENIYDTTIPVKTIFQFNGLEQYDAVFCDEVQDLPLVFLTKLKNSSNTVIVAGDENQSIYTNVPQFNTPPASPSEIESELSADSKPLTYIYRMTRSVVRIISKVFTSLLLGRPNVEKIDVAIKVCMSSSQTKEIEYVWKEAMKMKSRRADEIVAILIPEISKIIEFSNMVLSSSNKPEWETQLNIFGKTHFGLLNNHFENNNIPLMYIGQGYGSLKIADENNKIIIMTYHSAKGLDFDHVFLPLLDTSIRLPNDNAKTLLFVALSRSKQNLMVSYSYEPYFHLRPFIEGEPVLDIDALSTPPEKARIII